MILFNENLFFLILKYVVLGIGLPVFIILFFIKARYGRYFNKKWGPSINEKTGWVIMESISPIIFFIFYIISNRKSDLMSLIFLVIWEFHYIQRAFIYPFLMRGKKRMPLSIIVMGLIFNGLNAYLQGRYLFLLSDIYQSNWLTTPVFILGSLIFITGFIININSDSILRHLRKPGENNGYKIPYGGLFKYISCPNYFGEILEWIGWAILTFSLPGLIFAVWTSANLVPRAISHHKWYLAKFEEYPKRRKAIIPGIL